MNRGWNAVFLLSSSSSSSSTSKAQKSSRHHHHHHHQHQHQHLHRLFSRRFRRNQTTAFWLVSSLFFLPLVASTGSGSSSSSGSSSGSSITKIDPQYPSSFIFRQQRRFFETTAATSSSSSSSFLPMVVMSSSAAKRDSPSAQRNKQLIWEVLDEKVFTPLIRLIKDGNGNGDNGNEKQPIRVLEVAAGCGVHMNHFSTQLQQMKKQPYFLWYPTDPGEDDRASILCYIKENEEQQQQQQVLSSTTTTNKIMVQPPMPLTLNEHGIMEPGTVAALRAASAGGGGGEQQNGVASASASSLDVITCINMIHISPWQATLGLMKLAGESLSPDGILYCYGPYKVGGTAVQSNLNFDQNLKSRDPSWGVRDLEAVCKAATEQGLELVEQIEMPANNLSLLFRKRR